MSSPVRPEVLLRLADLQREIASIEVEHGIQRPSRAGDGANLMTIADRLLATSAREARVVHDATGVLRAATLSVEHLLGWPRDEIVGRSMYELVVADDAPLLAAAQTTAANGEPAEVELRLRTAEGDARWLRVEIAHGRGSRSESIFACLLSETPRDRRSNVALSHADGALKPILEALPDVVLVVSEGRVTYANRAAGELLGYEGDGLIGVDVALVFHADDRPAPSTGRRQLRARDVRLLRRDGAIVEVEARDVPFVMGGVPAQLLSARDVRERKRLESQLLLAERMASMGTLAAGVAHEINNPLTYVIGNLAVVEEELRAPSLPPARMPELAQLLADSLEGAERVRRVVRELRAFSHGEEDTRQHAVDVVAVLSRTLALVGHDLRARARVEERFERVPPALATEQSLSQLFLHLLMNAVHALPPGELEQNRVVVTTSSLEGSVLVEVKDTGVGIAKADLPRVFDPFFAPRDPGTGAILGLAVCHGLVTRLGGTITVDSDLGRGSVVRVLLPVASPDSSPRSMPLSRREGSRARVLVIEDEPPIAAVLRRLLGPTYDVSTTTTATTALEWIRAGERFQLILCDLMMPEISGMDFHEILAKERPDLVSRVVFITGGAFTPRAREFLKTSGVTCVAKPFHAADIRALVAERLGPG